MKVWRRKKDKDQLSSQKGHNDTAACTSTGSSINGSSIASSMTPPRIGINNPGSSNRSHKSSPYSEKIEGSAMAMFARMSTTIAETLSENEFGKQSNSLYRPDSQYLSKVIHPVECKRDIFVQSVTPVKEKGRVKSKSIYRAHVTNKSPYLESNNVHMHTLAPISSSHGGRGSGNKSRKDDHDGFRRHELNILTERFPLEMNMNMNTCEPTSFYHAVTDGLSKAHFYPSDEDEKDNAQLTSLNSLRSQSYHMEDDENMPSVPSTSNVYDLPKSTTTSVIIDNKLSFSNHVTGRNPSRAFEPTASDMDKMNETSKTPVYYPSDEDVESGAWKKRLVSLRSELYYMENDAHLPSVPSTPKANDFPQIATATRSDGNELSSSNLVIGGNLSGERAECQEEERDDKDSSVISIVSTGTSNSSEKIQTSSNSRASKDTSRATNEGRDVLIATSVAEDGSRKSSELSCFRPNNQLRVDTGTMPTFQQDRVGRGVANMIVSDEDEENITLPVSHLSRPAQSRPNHELRVDTGRSETFSGVGTNVSHQGKRAELPRISTTRSNGTEVSPSSTVSSLTMPAELEYYQTPRDVFHKQMRSSVHMGAIAEYDDAIIAEYDVIRSHDYDATEEAEFSEI